jgi:hypothetical protein
MQRSPSGVVDRGPEEEGLEDRASIILKAANPTGVDG